MNSIDVKAEVLCYLRFIRQYELVAVEQFNQDIIAVDGRRRMIWVEVKVSIGDLLNDRKKSFHEAVRAKRGLPLFLKHSVKPLWDPFDWALFPARFFFAVPDQIAEKAEEKIKAWFPWAGLLRVARDPNRRYLGHCITAVRMAEHIHDSKLDVKSCVRLVKSQSASLANAYSRLSRGTK